MTSPGFKAPAADVLTCHNDNARTGQNLQEEVLTLNNVDAAHFGKLWVLPTDGKVDAQPLYAAGVSIPGKGLRNVLFVATEHDTIYAFDADTTNLFWKAFMVAGGESPSDPRGCDQVVPEIGITATPVIDRNAGPNGTLFLIAMSKDGAGHYFQRLHALDLSTGADRVTPVAITANYPGSGDNSQGGSVIFDPAQYKERPGLLLLNGVIYTAWSSHCDIRPYTGWIIGYDAQTLTRKFVLNLTPNGNSGAIWMSGAGLAADADGYVYCLAGNGTFDNTLTTNGFPNQGDFGNAFLKLSASSNSLSVSDYFATFQTPTQNGLDLDLGSGGALVLPDMLDSLGQTKRLAVGAGKDQHIYLVDRSYLGKFNPTNDSGIYQKLSNALPGGAWSMPAYFNGVLYYGAVGQPIQAFPLQQALLSSASAQTPGSFPYPGATPSVSASGTDNGIIWAVENTSPAVLHAYAATNLARELYNSSQAAAGRDQFGSGNKFITPTVASARVYVGTTNGVGVFGLLNTTTLTPLQSWRNTYFGNPSSAGAGADTATPAGDGVVNILKYALGLDPSTHANPDQFLASGLQSSNSQMFLTLNINRTRRASDISYVVEVSSDMHNWTSGGTNTTVLTNTETQLTVRDNTASGSSPRYMRLAILNDLTGLGSKSLSFTNSALITIPDSGNATPYPSSLNVSGLTGRVSKVTVTLSQLSHTFVHDVNVLLASPGGQSVLLMAHVGGTLGATNINVTFDDSASASMPANSLLSSGTYKPTNGGGTVAFPNPAPAASYGAILSALNGSVPNGVWSLYVIDDADNDKGSISGGWKLAITTTNGPPLITAQPANQTVTAGAAVTFTVGAAGDLPIGYQWRLFGTNLPNGSIVSGANSNTLVLNGVQAAQAGQYSAVVSNPFGAVTSSVATLTVIVPNPAQIINLSATGIQSTNAVLNGQVTSTGGNVPTVTLFYGPINGLTVPSGWARSVDLGLQSGVISDAVTGLSPNTSYYYTFRAVNSAGTTWASPSASFTTLATNAGNSAVAVLKHRYDNANTGANLRETTLNTANVNTNQFGLLYSRAVDDQIYAQPLIMTNVSIPGKGIHNLVIVATVNDSVYAFDADNAAVTSPYWQVSFLGANKVAPNSTDLLASPCGSFFNISGNFGIIGTPVIDPATSTLYLVARTKEFGTNFVQRLHALNISNGSERSNSPVTIAATYPGTGTGSISGILTFDPFKQNQRPALTLLNGTVLIGWGSHCDWDPYHGWLMGYDAATLQQTFVYNTSPNGTEAAIWMSGGAPAADPNGNIYVSVGNGSVGSSGNPRNLINRGESYLKLTPNGSALNVTSWFTPFNWANLEANDLDLGAAGILLIPGTTLMFSGGKEGKAYLVDRDNMGGLSSISADTNIIQSFQVTATSGANNIHGTPAWWDGPNGSYAYIQGESDYLRQYKFDRVNGSFLLPSFAQSPSTAPVGGMPGGFICVSANGATPGSGIVWASHQFSGNAQGQIRPGILHAYAADNVAHELWNSEQLSARDSVGNFAKYCPPVVANGKVYLATFSNRLNVYGLGLTPPGSDSFAAAQSLSGNSGSVSANNVNATKQAGEPNHAGNPGGASVWFKWTAPSTSPVTFDTALSGIDTLLAVYTGSAVGSLTLIASNNDMNANSTRSRLTFTPNAGTTYMIAVDGANGAEGNLALRWAQASAPLPNLSLVGSAVSPVISTETFSPSSCAVMEGLIQSGTRTIIRFNTQTLNSGGTDLYFGNPASNPLFVWAPCHAHYHMNNYMSYRLRDVNANLVAIGFKVGFCVLDSFRWDPNSAVTALYNCDNQGIQNGWGDLYDSTLDGQWIDITGLPTGNYTIEMEANPDGIIQESSYGDNITMVPIVIGDPSAPPANNDFANAQTLLGGFASVQGNNQNATKEAGEPTHAGNAGGHSLWYQWTALDTKPVTIDTFGSGFNTLLAVYTGNSLASLTSVASNDDSGAPTNLQSRVTFAATSGVVYNIAVDGFNGATGSVVLTLNQTIQNDGFPFCTFVGGVGGSIHGSNAGATKEPGEPNHAGNNGGASIWYCWTAPMAGVASFDTIGSTFNTLLGIYTGTSVSNLTQIAANDDIDPGNGIRQSGVSFNAVGLTMYHIAIDGLNGATGDTLLNWNLSGTSGTPLAFAIPSLQESTPWALAQAARAVLSQKFLSGGELELKIDGQPLRLYRVEVSPDLVSWRPLVTTLADPSGRAYFTDKTTHSTSRAARDAVCGPNQVTGIVTPSQFSRFYRAVAVGSY